MGVGVASISTSSLMDNMSSSHDCSYGQMISKYCQLDSTEAVAAPDAVGGTAAAVEEYNVHETTYLERHLQPYTVSPNGSEQ